MLMNQAQHFILRKQTHQTQKKLFRKKNKETKVEILKSQIVKKLLSKMKKKRRNCVTFFSLSQVGVAKNS